MAEDHIPWVVSIWPSAELQSTIDKIKKHPRCYREQKLCPMDGCDCETSNSQPLHRDSPAADEEQRS
jgi:hypothetical protein